MNAFNALFDDRPPDKPWTRTLTRPSESAGTFDIIRPVDVRVVARDDKTNS